MVMVLMRESRGMRGRRIQGQRQRPVIHTVVAQLTQISHAHNLKFSLHHSVNSTVSHRHTQPSHYPPQRTCLTHRKSSLPLPLNIHTVRIYGGSVVGRRHSNAAAQLYDVQYGVLTEDQGVWRSSPRPCLAYRWTPTSTMYACTLVVPA